MKDATTHQELISDAFHALNQPMTALRCTLELALATARSPEQYCKSLHVALEKADEIARWTRGIGEWVQAEAAEEHRQILLLNEYVFESIESLALVAEMAQIDCTVDLRQENRVWLAPATLKQVLFRMLEFILKEAGPGGAVRVGDIRNGSETIIEFAASRPGTAHDTASRDPKANPREIWRELTVRSAIARV